MKKLIFISIVSVVLFSSYNKLYAQLKITTVAGNGTAGYFEGTGISPTASWLKSPVAAVSDTLGNIYFADFGNQRVRKADIAADIIITLAGTGVAGFSGDGGKGDTAKLNNPTGVAVYKTQSLYIADRSNHRVRKIDLATGNISTVAGSGAAGFSGDGGLATAAQLNNPTGVAVDKSGNIYITDLSNQRIRKINIGSGNISTIAGTGIAGFSGDGNLATAAQLNNPTGIALDTAGNIYITDLGNQRIRKITVSTGNISTVAGAGTTGFSGDGGLATVAEFDNPTGIAVDDSGNIYVSDINNQRIRKITKVTGNISTIAGTGVAGFSGDNGSAVLAKLDAPSGIALTKNGDLLIADRNNHRIRKLYGCYDPDRPVITASDDTVCFGDTVTLSVTSGNLNSATSWQWYKNACCPFSANIGFGTTIKVIPSLGDKNLYYARGEGGCITQSLPDSVNVVANDIPIVQINASATQLCLGDSVVLIGEEVSGSETDIVFSWDNGVMDGIGFFPDTTRTYSVTGTYTDGCSDKSEVTITVNPLPLVDIGPDTFLCPGQSIILTPGSGFVGYLWSDGSTLPNLWVENPGAYYVEVTSVKGCKNSDTINIAPCTGVSQVASGIIQIYPLPVEEGILYVAFQAIETLQELSIKDINGKTVFKETFPNVRNITIELNLNKLNSGIYFIESQTDKQLYKNKILMLPR